jgi:hypothetical protein
MADPTPNTDVRRGHSGQTLPPCACTSCGYRLDAATDAEMGGARPRPGDTSICARCGALYLYADDLSLRAPGIGELAMLLADERTLTLLRAIDRVGQWPP